VLISIYILFFKNGGIDKSGHTKAIVKNCLVAWTFNGPEKKTMERFRKIKGLKNYLQYLTLKKEYETKKVAASLTFKMNKIKYTKRKTCIFD
jgi:hypothetical protein